MNIVEILRRRLSQLNKQLAQWGLPAFRKIGNFKQGEWEATGKIINVYSASDPFFTVPTLEVKQPFTGKIGSYSYISQRRTGICVVTLINKEFVVCVKQHRFQIGQWIVDFPRGCVADKDNAGLELVQREIPGLFEICQVNFAALISRPLWEDTGIKDSAVPIYLLCLESEIKTQAQLQEILRKKSRKDIVPFVWTLKEVNEKIETGGIDDLHSITAWYFAKIYLRKHFQIPIV